MQKYKLYAICLEYDPSLVVDYIVDNSLGGLMDCQAFWYHLIAV